ncbi:hypothetical protein TL16_g07689 [Triparma laevis f. inornata]|uniref:Kinesin light chain n=1 Tax=Triparma laevis f. inornata TaxID=1714386 RepID=A0A9W7EIK0_9STRA|nr:hypothetical protein TL16_g07689 [Triparma laevis f. inornata]
MRITRSEELVKLRALAKLCGRDFFDDPSLRAVAWRRILEVLELAMPEEKKFRGKKKQKKKKNDLRKLEILDTCFALGVACNLVGDLDDAKRYQERAKEGYEEQLGRENEKALEATYSLTMLTCKSEEELIEKLRDLAKRMERALGEENVVTLKTLNTLGNMLKNNGQYEEAIKVWERCLAGQMKVLGEDHMETSMTLGNLGNVYNKLRNYEKALEYYERALKGNEKLLGKNHPSTLMTVERSAILYKKTEDYGKTEELYQRALEGYEAQLGKDHKDTKRCTKNFKICLEMSGNSARLAELIMSYPWLNSKK